MSQNKIWTFGRNLPLAKLGSERVNSALFSEYEKEGVNRVVTLTVDGYFFPILTADS